MSTDVISYAERRDIFDRLRALEQDLKLDRARLDGQSNTIQAIVREVSAISFRMDAQRGILRTDPITQPLPASPAPVEPDPVPETPEQTAERLLSDPEAFAAVLRSIGLNTNEKHRACLVDAMRALELPSYTRTGLRLLAAAIAAGSFSS